MDKAQEPRAQSASEMADHEVENQHDLQKCIDLAFAEHAGKTVSELQVLLEDAVVAAGHRKPPKTWLHAVSGEIADGRRYITGTWAGGTGTADAPT